jgi:hypothetical protein
MAILIDTSVLLAHASIKDINHSAASQIMRSLMDEVRIVPSPVLSELFYMATVRLGYMWAIRVFTTTRIAFQIEPLTELDMVRMEQIMSQYHDAEFDYADAALMALAERLDITRICTFDRRDFSIFRPKHCPYLELLP